MLSSKYLIYIYNSAVEKVAIMKTKLSICILTMFTLSGHTSAQTAYISNNGSGSGYSINQPASIYDINNLLSDTRLDTIKLQPGIYKQTDALYITQGTHPVEIIGEQGVIFSSNYNYAPGDNSGIVVARSNLSFKNMNFLNTRYCFRFKDISVQNILIESITAHNTMSCIDFDSNITANVSNILINDIKSLGYHKAGVRVNGRTPNNISITNSVFDGLASSNETERSCHIAGIIISGATRDILIQNVSIANNIGGVDNCGSYQQGDGIVINADVKNVSIINTVVSNSKDADFDLKGENTTLQNITSSSGKEARYNLKLWNNEYTCTNCYINSANVNAVQAIDSQVTFMGSTFKVKEDSKLCDLRNYNRSDTQIKFSNSQYSLNGDLSFIPKQVINCEQP